MYTDGVDSSCPFPTRTLCFPCILKTGQSNHLLATLPSGHGSLVKPKASNMSYRADLSELHVFAKISSADRVITPPKLLLFWGPWKYWCWGTEKHVLQTSCIWKRTHVGRECIATCDVRGAGILALSVGSTCDCFIHLLLRNLKSSGRQRSKWVDEMKMKVWPHKW